MCASVRSLAMLAALGALASMLTGCNDNGGTDDYRLGGTVSGLAAGESVLLQNNGADTLTVSANGSFSFSESVSSGASYSVSVLQQPVGQVCSVANGSGSVPASHSVLTLGSNNAFTPVAVNCITNTYSIGGTVTGYSTGTGLTLEDNDGPALAISVNGAFTFPAKVPSGAIYDVTIASQPTGATPPKCTVSNGSGSVAAANVTSVAVTCSVTRAQNAWIWQSGSDTAQAVGVYGTIGTPAPGNVPTARYGHVSWTDRGGNFWLFGGFVETPVTNGQLNDLWEYTPATSLWTWRAGSSQVDSTGNYGTQGVAAASNEPPARSHPVSWTDAAGNLWLFGGSSFSNTLNDLWRYAPSSGLWTWMTGSSSANAAGIYGTQGVPSAANTPGARFGATSATDSSGKLWLFGGGGPGNLNDLWSYTVTSGEWTWVSGSNTTGGSPSYGTRGTATASNHPGARYGAVSWFDSSDNLWLFGGTGVDSNGHIGPLNDLWKYNVAVGLWTWVSGSNVIIAGAVYGTQGVAAPGNVPGAREFAVSWIDASGNLWFFGGTTAPSSSDMNDLWEYSPSSGLWTWVSGSKQLDQPGVYGTLGTPAEGNVPGARDSSTGWVDEAGRLWLFGGNGFAVADQLYPATLNDLWEYTPP